MVSVFPKVEISNSRRHMFKVRRANLGLARQIVFLYKMVVGWIMLLGKVTIVAFGPLRMASECVGVR